MQSLDNDIHQAARHHDHSRHGLAFGMLLDAFIGNRHRLRLDLVDIQRHLQTGSHPAIDLHHNRVGFVHTQRLVVYRPSRVRQQLRLAQTLGLKVVAEGVEAAEDEVLLKKMACDEIQGYLYSKPVSAEDFETWLESRLSVSRVLQANS